MLQANLIHSKVVTAIKFNGSQGMVRGDNLLCRINGFVNVSDGDYDVVTSMQGELRLLNIKAICKVGWVKLQLFSPES